MLLGLRCDLLLRVVNLSQDVVNAFEDIVPQLVINAVTLGVSSRFFLVARTLIFVVNFLFYLV